MSLPEPKPRTTFVWDLEFSKLRHGGMREMGDLPPRVTQFGLVKYEHLGAEVLSKDVVIGGGRGRGFTALLEKYVKQFNVVDHNRIPEAFFRQLVADGVYNPSVLTKSQFSPLHDQVIQHVKHILQADAPLPSAEDYVKEMQRSIQAELDKGKSVTLLSWNKDIDTDVLLGELGHTDPTKRQEYLDWLKSAQAQGLAMEGGERGVHQAMFEEMLRDKDYIPHYRNLRRLDQEFYKGTPVSQLGEEVIQDHLALREYVNDIETVALGQKTADEVWGEVPEKTRELLRRFEGVGKKEAFEVMQAIEGEMNTNALHRQNLINNYDRVVRIRHSEQVAAHVSNVSFSYTGGIWAQDTVSEARKKAVEGAHDALTDAETTFMHHRELMLSESAQEARADLMAATRDSEFKTAQIHRGAGKFYEERGAEKVLSEADDVGKKLIKEGLGDAKGITRALGRLVKNKWFAPLAATAGALFAINRLGRSLSKDSAEHDIPWRYKQKIEALRSPQTDYLRLHGIVPSEYPYANVSSFGTGRDFSHQLYNEQSMEHPYLGRVRQMYMRPDVQRNLAWQKAQPGRPKGRFSPLERRTGLIDVSEYIMSMVDADTIQMRRAWLDRDIPVLGGLVGGIQKMVYSGLESMGGRGLLDALTPQIDVRIDGIDAPEVAHGKYRVPQPQGVQARQIAIDTLQEADFLKLNAKAGAYGRPVVTPMTDDGKDLARMIVARGAAMSFTDKYQSAEETAMGAAQGIWQEPFFWGLAEAKKSGLPIAFSQMSKIETVSSKMEIAAAYSMGLWAQWGRSHYSGFRDQRAQLSRIISSGPKNRQTTGNYGSVMA